MKIKSSPQRYSDPASQEPDTIITIMDDWNVNVDGEVYTFDSTDVQWPTISTDTNGVIQEAHLESGELYLTILRRYTVFTGCPWDTGVYQ